MDILGIGIPELGFIILIAIIVLGPKDMQKAGKTIGTWMRKVVLSPEWREIKNASRQIKSIPTQLMREANLEEFAEFKSDINVIMPKDKPKKSDNADVDAHYGAWGGISTPPKSTMKKKNETNMDAGLGTAKSASSSTKSSTASPLPIENEDA